MAQLKSNRNIGVFVLIPAPLNPIGAFDAEQFKRDVRTLLDFNHELKFLAVDLTGIDFVYSDAHNAFSMCQQDLRKVGGQFAVIADNKTLIASFKKMGMDRVFKIFGTEQDLATFTIEDAVSPRPFEKIKRLTVPPPALEEKQAKVVKVPSKVNHVAAAHGLDAKESSEKSKPAEASKPISTKPKKITPATVTNVNAALSAFEEEPSSSGKIAVVLVVIGIILGVIAYLVI